MYINATVKVKFVVADPGLLKRLKIIKSKKKKKNTSVIRTLPQVFCLFFYFSSHPSQRGANQIAAQLYAFEVITHQPLLPYFVLAQKHISILNLTFQLSILRQICT